MQRDKIIITETKWNQAIRNQYSRSREQCKWNKIVDTDIDI